MAGRPVIGRPVVAEVEDIQPVRHIGLGMSSRRLRAIQFLVAEVARLPFRPQVGSLATSATRLKSAPAPGSNRWTDHLKFQAGEPCGKWKLVTPGQGTAGRAGPGPRPGTTPTRRSTRSRCGRGDCAGPAPAREDFTDRPDQGGRVRGRDHADVPAVGDLRDAADPTGHARQARTRTPPAGRSAPPRSGSAGRTRRPPGTSRAAPPAAWRRAAGPGRRARAGRSGPGAARPADPGR